MGKKRSAWTPRGAQPVEVSVCLTRACIARGATYIPQRHADDIPAGTLTLVDEKNEAELQVEYVPPRQLRGFDDYLQHLDLKPNDVMVVRVYPDGRGELEFRTRPRRPAPTPAPESDSRESEKRDSRPSFIDWRPEPLDGVSPRPSEQEAVPAPAAAPAKRPTAPAAEPTSAHRKPLRAMLAELELRERRAQGWNLLKGLLAKGRHPGGLEEVTAPAFIPKPEFATPTRAARIAPHPAPRARVVDQVDHAWDETGAWDQERRGADTPTSEPEELPGAPTALPTIQGAAAPLPAEEPVAPTPEAAPHQPDASRPTATEADELGDTAGEPAAPSGDDLEPLRRVREYLARPETPLIVRLDDVAAALAFDRETTGSLLEHIADESETNVNRIKDGAYMVKRTAV